MSGTGIDDDPGGRGPRWVIVVAVIVVAVAWVALVAWAYDGQGPTP